MIGSVSDERIVTTPHGEGRIVAHRARRPIATLALGHGAGGGIGAQDLARLARRLPGQDINVFLIEQPYRRAGRKAPPPAKVLDEGWLSVAVAPAPGWRAGRRPSSARPAYSAWLFRCTRRAGRRSREWMS